MRRLLTRTLPASLGAAVPSGPAVPFDAVVPSDPAVPFDAAVPSDPAVPFDAAVPYRLHPDVALRPEPFGALAYHYGSRRLTFLRSPLLVDVVRSLTDHPSVQAAVDAQVPGDRRPGFLRAIASLADSRFIVPVPEPIAETNA